MDEIEQRLRETTDACIKNLEDWAKGGKSNETRETLMDAMHEVRKVLARVEIEIAISERDRLGSRPLPIPPHRSSRKSHHGEDGDLSEDDYAAMDAAASQPRQSGGGSGSGRPQGGRGRRPGPPRGNNNNNDNRGNNGGDAQP